MQINIENQVSSAAGEPKVREELVFKALECSAHPFQQMICGGARAGLLVGCA